MVSRTIVASVCLFLLEAALAQPQIDSSSALMEALASGGSYQVAEGNYWIDRNIVIEHDLELVGSGAEDTVLFLTVGNAVLTHSAGDLVLRDLTLAYIAGAPGDILHVPAGTVELTGVTLSGARSGVDSARTKRFGWGAGIVAWGSARVRLTDSTVRGSGLTAFELYEQASLELRASSVRENNVGLYATDQAHVVVSDSLFEANMWGAYQVLGEVASVISGTRFLANGVADEATGAEADGLRFGGHSSTQLLRNRFEANPRFAISAWGQALIEANANVFEGNGGEYDGLETYASALLLEEASGIVMQGDQFLANPGGALELGDHATANLTEVHMEGNGSWAYVYTEDRTDLRITRSTFVDNEGAVFVSGTGRLLLDQSVVSGAADEGIVVAGSVVARIENSVISNNVGVGLALYDTVNAYIAHNSVRENRSGVVLYQGSNAVIEHNQISDNEHTGLAALDGSTMEVRTNEVAGNGFNGVLVDNQAHALIEENTLLGNPRIGIGFSGESTGLAQGNHIATSAVAIGIGPEAWPEIGENEFVSNGEDVQHLP